MIGTRYSCNVQVIGLPDLGAFFEVEGCAGSCRELHVVGLAVTTTAVEDVDLDVHIVRFVSIGELEAVLEVTGLV